MSLAGSWPARRLRWFASRTDATPRARRPKALTVRGVTRDFALWEAECAGSDPAAGPRTMSTVIGGQRVEIPLGQRPIQEVALHLRRLRLAIDTMPADVSYVRWEGVMRAYDDYLFAACHELGVPTDLVLINHGRQRDDERARLERVLHRAGLPVR